MGSTQNEDTNTRTRTHRQVPMHPCLGIFYFSVIQSSRDNKHSVTLELFDLFLRQWLRKHNFLAVRQLHQRAQQSCNQQRPRWTTAPGRPLHMPWNACVLFSAKRIACFFFKHVHFLTCCKAFECPEVLLCGCKSIVITYSPILCHGIVLSGRACHTIAFGNPRWMKAFNFLLDNLEFNTLLWCFFFERLHAFVSSREAAGWCCHYKSVDLG